MSGRAEAEGLNVFRRQWPGTYFETAFRGTNAMFRIGQGDVNLRIRVDNGEPIPLLKPRPGLYRIEGLRPAAHRLRIDVASESQAGPTEFDGYFAAEGVTSAALSRRTRQIEFIGDSHTVGYGNISTTRECTEKDVWATTDTSQGVTSRVAGHFGADYQVNAISGRGIVRNYNGFVGDTLPQAYPYVLFDKRRPYADKSWRPQLIVIALGTNDFSTPLNPGEKWKTRDALRDDFENGYVRFVHALRVRNRRAFILLWLADAGGGETRSEVTKVIERLRQAGETRVAFVPVSGLGSTGCHFHPNVEDDEMIARTLSKFLDSQQRLWRTGD
jgi:lysophospholipase L1-like esterase